MTDSSSSKAGVRKLLKTVDAAKMEARLSLPSPDACTREGLRAELPETKAIS